MRIVTYVPPVVCALLLLACAVPISAAPSLERHAADEFVKYVGKLTGTESKMSPTGVCTLGQGKAQALIGRSALADSLLSTDPAGQKVRTAVYVHTW